MERAEQIRIASTHECNVNRYGFVKGAQWADAHQEKMPVTCYEKMKLALKLLDEVTKSGYIPFASPAPSSSEEVIKFNVITAKNQVEMAILNHKMCYGEK